MSPEAAQLAAELEAEAADLRLANADAPAPPPESLELLRALACPLPRRETTRKRSA